MEARIPEEVRRFIATHITSLEQLEVLLLVNALPDREWSADAVYQVVKTNPALVAQRLEEFSQGGIDDAVGRASNLSSRAEFGCSGPADCLTCVILQNEPSQSC